MVVSQTMKPQLPRSGCRRYVIACEPSVSSIVPVVSPQNEKKEPHVLSLVLVKLGL